MNKYLILDTESNGPGYAADVWQLSWQVVDTRFNSIKSDGGYLLPIKPMNSNAKQITGLDRKSLIKLAEPADKVYERFLHDLRSCKVVIGHSVDMDINRIVNDAKRRCEPELSNQMEAKLKAIHIFDTAKQTLAIAGKTVIRNKWWRGRLIRQKRLGYPSLGELAHKLGVDWTGIQQHTANGDVELTRRCMVAIAESYPSILPGINPKKPRKAPGATSKNSAIPEHVETLHEGDNPVVGTAYHGKVVDNLGFGVFVELAPNRQGFLHKNQIALQTSTNLEDAFQLGQVIDVVLTDYNYQTGKMSFSQLPSLDKLDRP
jgi:hypothetical protein